MGRCIRNPQGNHGGKGFGKRHMGGGEVPPWDKDSPDQDSCSDLRDLYDEPADPENDDYSWPSEDNEDDD